MVIIRITFAISSPTYSRGQLFGLAWCQTVMLLAPTQAGEDSLIIQLDGLVVKSVPYGLSRHYQVTHGSRGGHKSRIDDSKN